VIAYKSKARSIFADRSFSNRKNTKKQLTQCTVSRKTEVFLLFDNAIGAEAVVGLELASVISVR
jgi:hypothetical protein